MIYFDSQNPNKYSALKKELIPHILNDKKGRPFTKRKIGNGDGSYVLADNDNYFTSGHFSVLSYGIGDDPLGVSFEQCFSKIPKIKCYIEMYDGSIDKVPALISNSIFKKEYLTKDNFEDHVCWLKLRNSDHYILKMDIEGCEYDVFTEENFGLLKEFDQFTLEVHGLIEEVPDGWVIESAIQDAKNNLEKKVNFFKNLNKDFYLFHIHGNNHAPRYDDFPDSLELTYVNKKIGKSAGISQQACPDLSVDQRNYDSREDYKLSWWI